MKPNAPDYYAQVIKLWQSQVMMKRQPLVALIFLVALTQNSEGALRCGNSLINEGAWPVEVEEDCGLPDYRVEYPTTTLPGLGVVQTEEHWYYNPGPQSFIRRLIFRNGKLVRVDSLGYGFHVSDSPSCGISTLRHVKTEYELLARCGAPRSKQMEWRAPTLQNRFDNWQAAQPVLVQEWLYEFSSNQFRQVVTLKNGRVVDVESRP